MAEDKALNTGSKAAVSAPTKDNVMDEKTLEVAIAVNTNTSAAASVSNPIDITNRNETGTPSKPDEADGEVQYPQGIRLAIIIVGLELAVLCVALDNTIVATAIPKITDHFNALDDIGWYASAYLLTTCAFQLFFGRLYSLTNVKWTFILTLGIFELGSLVCGVAPNSTALIIGRAIAGVGSSGIFSGALIILARSTPLQKRPLYTSLVSVVYVIASVVGPLLGGVFTDRISWRWCFYINLPVGGFTVAALVFFLDSQPAAPREKQSWLKTVARFDPLGTLIFMPCIICFLLAMQWGGTKYAWSSGRIISLFVVFGVLAVAFGIVQVWMGENATVPPRIAKQRTMAFGTFFSCCVSAAFFIMIYYIPIWFQAIRGVSATHSGINTLPLMIAVVAATVVGGIGTTAFGYYSPFMIATAVIAPIGAGLMYTWTVDISTGKWIGYQILFGFGGGIGMQSPIVAAQTVLGPADVPTGTAIIVFAQTFGGALFVSIAQTVFTNRLTAGLQQVSGIDPNRVVNTGATQITSLTTDPAILRAIKVVYNAAVTQTFLIALVLVCVAIIGAVGVEWKSVKPQPKDAGKVTEEAATPVPEEKSN